jgi:hypothetical protein
MTTNPRRELIIKKILNHWDIVKICAERIGQSQAEFAVSYRIDDIRPIEDGIRDFGPD